MTEDIKATLWKAADKLRAQMDAAEYKHIVLGLIFLKYVSDRFTERRDQLSEELTNPASDIYVDDPEKHEKELETRDYYTMERVFWVPADARWSKLRADAKQPDIGTRIDQALALIEKENPILQGMLDRRFAGTQLRSGTLGELIDLISTIGFGQKYGSVDLLGEVYEYFLGQFASAEGKKGGQFYTPASVVKTLVEVLSPLTGRVYDPCCGSGGMFVQSERFVEEHGGRVDDISIYGQESNPTTWRLVAMNLAIRGLRANLGKEPADTFANDQFPDTKFDYIMANPPFNIKDWGGEKHETDPRWKFGKPPNGNANFAWLQHILWKLAPQGQAGVVLANGSMSSHAGGEGKIREAMVQADVVEAMVALPGQLFFNTQIPACLWFFTNDKSSKGKAAREWGWRDRQGETLFVDARQLGTMQTRVVRAFTDSDISKIADTVNAWRAGDGYEDQAGFCKSASLEEIAQHDFELAPSRYVGVAAMEDDGEPFEEKMAALTADLREQQEEGRRLDAAIMKNLSALGLEPSISER